MRKHKTMSYDRKMIRIYLRKITEAVRMARWDAWQWINRRLLKTYPLIADCARCDDCGRNVHDFTAPDELWLEAMGHPGGILCYDCFCDRLDRKRITKIRMTLQPQWQLGEPKEATWK